MGSDILAVPYLSFLCLCLRSEIWIYMKTGPFDESGKQTELVLTAELSLQFYQSYSTLLYHIR